MSYHALYKERYVLRATVGRSNVISEGHQPITHQYRGDEKEDTTHTKKKKNGLDGRAERMHDRTGRYMTLRGEIIIERVYEYYWYCILYLYDYVVVLLCLWWEGEKSRKKL